MHASKELVAAIAAGVVLVVVIVWGLRRWIARSREARAARRERFKVRFQKAVRSEARRLVGGPSDEDELAMTRVWQRPEPSRTSSGVTRIEGRRLGLVESSEASDDLCGTIALRRSDILELHSDEAG